MASKHMTEMNIALFAVIKCDIQEVGYILQELKQPMCHIFKFACLFHPTVWPALIWNFQMCFLEDEAHCCSSRTALLQFTSAKLCLSIILSYLKKDES